MITISLCMIVKDEEAVLSKCLDSVKDLVDEIIIVDTGSKDKTKDLAYKYTDKVYDFQWIDDFSAARNYSFSKATKDYIFWLDADDIVLDKDLEEMKLLKGQLKLEYDAVIMKYVVQTDGNGEETYACYRERLVKRSNNFQWYDPIHEHINFYGKVLHTEIAITHTGTTANSSRNLAILKKVIEGSKNFHPKYLYYYARENYGLRNTEEAKKYYLEFLDIEPDIYSPYTEACIQLSQIYKEENKDKLALKTLIRSFEHGPLRAEVLCLIGKHYIDKKDYSTAVYWYKLALSIPRPKLTWMFVMEEYWEFIPYIELCHCYYHLGDLNAALGYHRKAYQLKAKHPAVVLNQEFFDSLIK
ncbi:MAG: glycosyltransferase [Clostridia bacterium]|nr:glycosyltransferase [Clostridia bacterium]